MYRKKTVTVVMPCRNEGAHLNDVVKRIPKFVDEIIIVSNCSTDNTVKEARRQGLVVFEDDRTLNGIGYGFAHMTGIAKASSHIIAGIDGDATYPIEKLHLMIDHLLDEDLDFISGNRYPLQTETSIPLKLRLGVQFLNFETRLLYGVRIKDILSGMWVFKADIKDKLRLTRGDWNLSPQIKIQAAINPAIRFGEFSIAQYSRRGESKQRHIRTGLSHMAWIFKNRFRAVK